MECMAVEVLAFHWDVDPETSLTADGASALNCKTDDVYGISRSGKVDVAARDIRVTGIVQRKVVHLLGG